MIPRAASTPVDRFAARLSDMLSRIKRLENISHRHNTNRSALVPAGGILETVPITTDPLGYLILDGRTITNADTEYPALWAVAPAGWKSGTSLTLSTETNKIIKAH